MIIGVPKETYPGETRVALIPAVIPSLIKAGMEVHIESGAGAESGYPDSAYTEKGAAIASSRLQLFETAKIIVQVRLLGANPEQGKTDLPLMQDGQLIIGLAEALSNPHALRELNTRKVLAFAMELMPRITRAQSMDVLSSMGTVAGYKAVLMAANALPKMFPMLMTAAGTVAPSKVLIIGAGVAGLQAISMARRLGASVEAYDLRPAVKEQVLSLGAKFVDLPLETADSEDKGGYAKAQDEEFYRKQRELLGKVIASSDVVVTTAAVPGKKAPILITADMVAAMAPGSVIVDLAAERGGNCELTKANQTVVAHGVTIIGQENIPSQVPYHASQMYSKNIATFLLHLVKKGELTLNMEDEITRETLLTRDGEIVHSRVREILGPLAGRRAEET
ncbi:Re/Si-specific NAD(P)(+) transhydrogenase subunit alpha [Candidatus Nitronereus thalassa]|uniref:proton-translocating NAD(P)(+) transhydrogenase n=1 Tax=Candidatus Nitronereus thalassa TaxID=3020898 RepID=A0ABU3K8K4_9BACT|nr:Re/Si-specific NAD(P)(+) transhydrogenase subunit alpha [Candidatus Nitronereus thalassa]MDT7042731.1 Re/Si-specific NAD(P)(+) transhydrogenase subunit alpha [Candidatus Nitronereus thalassa]